MTDIEAAAQTALRPISDALATDGYTLSAQGASDGAFVISISAMPDACEDCLAPKQVLEPMIRDLLNGAGVSTTTVDIHYPNT